MKTKNYFLNAALILMMVLSAGFIFSEAETNESNVLNTEKIEYADAGYWIDAVVVTGNSTISDKELCAGKGYFIDPVVVTYDADKAMLADKGYYIEPVVVTYQTGVPVHVYASK
jgi:hypothetical protein